MPNRPMISSAWASGRLKRATWASTSVTTMARASTTRMRVTYPVRHCCSVAVGSGRDGASGVGMMRMGPVVGSPPLPSGRRGRGAGLWRADPLCSVVAAGPEPAPCDGCAPRCERCSRAVVRRSVCGDVPSELLMDDSSPWWNAPRRSRLVPDRRRGTAAGASCDGGAVDGPRAARGVPMLSCDADAGQRPRPAWNPPSPRLISSGSASIPHAHPTSPEPDMGVLCCGLLVGASGEPGTARPV